ncbi:unnamed protein product [Camellia sinensis]
MKILKTLQIKISISSHITALKFKSQSFTPTIQLQINPGNPLITSISTQMDNGDGRIETSVGGELRVNQQDWCWGCDP